MTTFVTVGTTHFDPLIRAADHMAGQRRLPGPVVFQIGAGRYEPVNGAFFRFKPSIDDELADADLVITHGGATVFALLALRKRFVAVANTSLDGNHQARFLSFLGERSSVIWADDPAMLEQAVTEAINHAPARLEAPSLAPDLLTYMGVCDTRAA
ncbi:glycosyltransferase [Denitromonas iodatirespirans]|uniref:Glycosyl transferase family 28 C-terminal domain-containing protein n=1 Tax=Denitromonas iodatirespirans TaxID=2795389 RepID=A0A944D684_DENI1|nr:glycosyltransferase [Denitromonas iodatirespirans]MBT0960605.1 hypothetical protein [Denitromonas iodatirespirans]